VVLSGRTLVQKTKFASPKWVEYPISPNPISNKTRDEHDCIFHVELHEAILSARYHPKALINRQMDMRETERAVQIVAFHDIHPEHIADRPDHGVY
jgi:hypothetical protein